MTIWLISDLHLFHTNMLRGQKIGIRSFDTLEQMHDAIVTGWNSVVKPNDKVYMLGDLTLTRPPRDNKPSNEPGVWSICQQLQGKKRIILGNHDYFGANHYHHFGFEKVLAMRVMGDTLLTHIPVHTSQFSRFRGNVHGHTHESVVKKEDAIDGLVWDMVPDTRYVNVCVEPLNYVPISLEDARSRIHV